MTSVTARLTGWYAVTVTLAVVAALGVGRLLLEREMTAGIDLLHEAEFREVIQQLRADPETLAPAELARLMAEHSAADEHLFFFQVHDEEGRVLFRSANLGDTVLPDYSEGHAVAWTTELPIYGKVRGNDFLAGRLHFQIASRVGPMAQVLRQYTQVGGLIALLVALASLGLGYVISRVALRPIRDIERTARRIGADNLNERIPAPPGRDEVAGLVKLLNAMFDRLESSFRQIARFSADASHELKTPLTLIRLNTERVRARVAGDEVAVAEVDGLLEEIARMQEIINSLLFLAKAEGGALKIAREEHAAEEFVRSIAEDALVLAEDAGQHLSVARNDAFRPRFEPGLLRQVMLNLVSNAVAVMPAGGTVTLSSAQVGAQWQLEVVDEGPGLPSEQLTSMFERFAQLPRPAGGEAKGNGLGLAICRSIVRLHGGEITAANREDRSGLRLRVVLPA